MWGVFLCFSCIVHWVLLGERCCLIIFSENILNRKSSKNAILNPYEYNLLPSNLSWSFHTFIFFSICVGTLFDKSWNLFISENIIYQAPEIKTWYIMVFSYISHMKYGKILNALKKCLMGRGFGSVSGHICTKETEQLIKELEMKCFRWWIRFWPGYGHGEWRKKRAHHSAEGAGLNKGTKEENRAYSGSTKQTSLARIYDMYTDAVRISPENLYMLSRDEWRAEESLLNFVEKVILQKFS